MVLLPVTPKWIALPLGTVLLVLLLGTAGETPSAADYRFSRLAAPHVETVTGWMARNLASKGTASWTGRTAGREEIREYFSIADRLAALANPVEGGGSTGLAKLDLSGTAASLRSAASSLEPSVERAIEQEVSSALSAAGLAWWLAGLETVMPPVVFRFEALPNLLVVSPRSRIERIATVLLEHGLSDAAVEEIEERARGEDFAGYVTRIGGLGTYPSMVPENPDLGWVLRTVSHEWTHQFLALRPVGWRYAFGGERDQRMVTVNETIAEIVGREIGERVYESRFREIRAPAGRSTRGNQGLRALLRSVRLKVDGLLAQGKVEEAETFMNASRDDLAERGFALRKLNQAYFAFHGSYADQPAFAGKAGEDLAGRIHALRGRPGTLGEFVWRISEAGNFDEFRAMAPSAVR